MSHLKEILKMSQNKSNIYKKRKLENINKLYEIKFKK